MLRNKIRGTYRINGSVCGDCCKSHCCPYVSEFIYNYNKISILKSKLVQ